MKVILFAFGRRLMSNIMDIPEECHCEFTLCLTQPKRNIANYAGDIIKSHAPFSTRCSFINTHANMPYKDENGQTELAAIFELDKINKL